MQGAGQPLPLGFAGFLARFAILMALATIPLLLTELPPLLDYPNHLARMHLLPTLPSPLLQPFYTVAWAPLPNLGMDGVVPFLARVIPLEWAGKVFIVVTFVLLAGGTAAIHRALFGRWTWWPYLAFLLLYTRLLLWGFMGYLFGCGLALAAFAVWITVRERHWAMRLLLGCVFASVIYLAHLLAFGVYAVMIAGYELGLAWRRRAQVVAALRDLAIGAAPFLPALLLMSANSSTGQIVYASPLRKIDLLFSVFDNYNRPFDIVCFILVAITLAVAFQRRWVRLAPEISGPLIGLVLLYLAMPTQLFTASGADRRIPMMIFLVLIAGSCFVGPRPALERCFMTAAAILFAARLVVVGVVWHSAGRLYAELLPGFDAVPRGSCVATAFDREGLSVQKAPLAHFSTLAVARRDAFVTTLFAFPTQQPIALTGAARILADALSPDALWTAFVEGTVPLSLPERAALAHCDYVAFAGTRDFTLVNRTGLEPSFVRPRFQIYRVVRTAAS